MKELDIKVNELPFTDFYTSRYSISCKIGAQNTYDYAKKHDMSFFILSLGCLLKGLNSVSEFKRRIIDNKVVEFNKIDAITPLLDSDKNLLEMKVSLKDDKTLKEWHDDILVQKAKIENKIVKGFEVDMQERDTLPIANFSCIPWIDFDSMTNPIAEPHQIQPLITWGKLVDGKISITITVSHIFIFGYHLGLFIEKIEECFKNPELIVE